MAVVIAGSNTGASLRGVLLGFFSVRTIVFAVSFGVLALLVHVIVRRVARRRGIPDNLRWLIVLSIWFVLGVVLAVAAWGLRALGLLQFAWGGLIPLGCAYFGYGLQRRIGSALHCEHCGYPFSEEGGKNCPECGSVWSAQVGTIAGEPRRSSTFIAVGAVLMVLALSLSLSPLLAGSISRFVPTGVLIGQVAGVGGSTPGAWAELTKRTLTEEQTSDLIRRLLDTRLESGRLDGRSAAWLDGQFAAGGLDAALTARYYREMVSLRLREEPVPDLEGFVEIRAVAVNRSTPFGPTEVRIVFRGFTADNQPVANTLLPRYSSVYRFDEWTQSRKPEESVPTFTIARRAQDQIRVTAEAWICYGAATQLSWGAAWDEAGEPIIPFGLPWVEHVVLEHTVEKRD